MAFLLNMCVFIHVFECVLCKVQKQLKDWIPDSVRHTLRDVNANGSGPGLLLTYEIRKAETL